LPETVPPMFVASSILKLQPGDLFISSRPAIEGTWLGLRLPDQRTSGWCLALKPDDEVARRSKPMRLDRKCLSLGQNYKIRLPIDPEEWLLSSDPTRWPALGILETGPAIGFPTPSLCGGRSCCPALMVTGSQLTNSVPRQPLFDSGFGPTYRFRTF